VLLSYYINLNKKSPEVRAFVISFIVREAVVVPEVWEEQAEDAGMKQVQPPELIPS